MIRVAALDRDPNLAAALAVAAAWTAAATAAWWTATHRAEP